MSEEKINGITRIAVKGFKSITEEREIDIRPLTILAGANSSGKSSIMQPLLMLKQTLEAPYDPGPLLIDGPNVKFTEVAQFLSILPDGKRADHFRIRIGTSMSSFSHSVETTFRNVPGGIEIVKMTSKVKPEEDSPVFPEHLTLYPGMPPEEIKALTDQYMILRVAGVDVVKRSRCFLRLASQSSSRSLNLDTTVKLASDPEGDILDSIHLHGLRGNPARTYKLTNTGPLYPGTFDNYVASLIHDWQEAKDNRLKKVADALYTLGLTGQVGTRKIGDVGIELQVGRLPHNSADETDMVNIADVGLGVSQVLPALVAVVTAKEGQLVYLEQPELHLHPRAQVALARVLADAAKRGVRVVAETHSSLLLLGVQTLVAEGDLPPELVNLHWFSRREDGVTEVTSADLDETGAYGEWPEDFDDVDLKTQSRYLNAVDRIRFGKEEAS